MMSEEQLTATTDEVVASDVAVDTDIELEEEEVQEIVSPEVAAFRAAHFIWRISSLKSKSLKKR